MNEMAVTVVGLGLMFTLTGAGLWLLLHVDRQIKACGCLLMAAGALSQVVMNVLLDSPRAAALNAAFVALHLWNWWNNGGGDGLKRRLKAWADSLGRSPQTV